MLGYWSPSKSKSKSLILVCRDGDGQRRLICCSRWGRKERQQQRFIKEDIFKRHLEAKRQHWRTRIKEDEHIDCASPSPILWYWSVPSVSHSGAIASIYNNRDIGKETTYPILLPIFVYVIALFISHSNYILSPLFYSFLQCHVAYVKAQI